MLFLQFKFFFLINIVCEYDINLFTLLHFFFRFFLFVIRIHTLTKKNNDIHFKIKLHLRERIRRAEAGKNAGSIAADNCHGDLLAQPDCLQRVSSRLEKFSS